MKKWKMTKLIVVTVFMLYILAKTKRKTIEI